MQASQDEPIASHNLPSSIGTKANAMKCAAEFCFILWMALQIAQFMNTMSKLTFVAIFAFTSLLKRTTEFSFVAAK